MDCNSKWGAHACDRGILPDPMDRVDDAIANLEKLAFVGITEEWDESICLFHLMFGGRLHAGEFKNVHPGYGKEDLEEYPGDDFAGFVDEADEAIYLAAKARFEKLRHRYTGGGSSACAHISGAQDRASLPSTDCRQLGLQCGGHTQPRRRFTSAPLGSCSS